MKKEVDIFEYAGHILEHLKTGILITTKNKDFVNSMTIAWGSLGIEWRKPIFITYVRENRFTREMLDKNPEFTVNIPYGKSEHNILKYCGNYSGRDVDKIKKLDLHLVKSDIISVPAIKELPLTLECRVLYKQLQNKDAIPKDIRRSCYPEDIPSENSGLNRDYHIAYYGEILKAYICSDD